MHHHFHSKDCAVSCHDAASENSENDALICGIATPAQIIKFSLACFFFENYSFEILLEGVMSRYKGQ